MRGAFSDAHIEQIASLYGDNRWNYNGFKKIIHTFAIFITLMVIIIPLASAQGNTLSGQFEVADSISDIGNVDLSLVTNPIFNQNGVAVWQITPDDNYPYLDQLKFYAKIDKNNNQLSVLLAGENQDKSLRGMIPSLYKLQGEDASLSSRPDPIHYCYPYDYSKTLIYSLLKDAFREIKLNSVIGSNAQLDGNPKYKSSFTDKVSIFGYYITSTNFNNDNFCYHNWPWGTGTDECIYGQGSYICDYSTGTVQVAFDFNLLNTKNYYIYGFISNDNGEETQYKYNNDVWLHQIDYGPGSTSNERFADNNFPSQIVLYGRKTWSANRLMTWMAINADSVSAAGHITGDGATHVDRDEDPDVLQSIALEKGAIEWPIMDQNLIFEDDFSIDKGWISNPPSGFIYRDSNQENVDFHTDRGSIQSMYHTITPLQDDFELSIDANLKSTYANGFIYIGLTNDMDDVNWYWKGLGIVIGQYAGYYFAQVAAKYSDGSMYFSLNDDPAKDKHIGISTNKWYTYKLTKNGQKWRLDAYDENKNLAGSISGEFTRSFSVPFKYVLFGNGDTSQWETAEGEIDNFKLSSTITPGLSSIGDLVWNDANKDGIQDKGENGIAGVKVNLYKSGLIDSIRSTQTDASGLYLFDSLEPGEYQVEFKLLDGYAFSPKDAAGEEVDDTIDSDADPSSGRTDRIKIVSGQNDMNWDAGINTDIFENIVFKDIKLIPYDPKAKYPMAGEDAKVRIVISNPNDQIIPAQKWKFKLSFYDIYGSGNDYLATIWRHDAFNEAKQLLQTREYGSLLNKPVDVPSILPQSSYPLDIPIKLNIRSPLDMSLAFADELDITGSPMYSLHEYSGVGSVYVEPRAPLSLGIDCLKAFVKNVVWDVIVELMLGGDLELAEVESFMRDCLTPCWYVFETGKSNQGTFDLAEFTAEVTKCLMHTVKAAAKRIVVPFYIIEKSYGLGIDCGAEYISSIVADYTFCLNLLGIKTHWYHIIDPQIGIKQIEIEIIKEAKKIDSSEKKFNANSSDEYILISDGDIKNNLPNSDAFFVGSDAIILINGEDNLTFSARSNVTGTVGVDCVTPTKGNNSKYEKFSIPITGTILTSKYTNINGLEPFDVDTNNDGKAEYISYPNTIKTENQIAGLSTKVEENPTSKVLGSRVRFKINVTNTGNTTLDSITILDELPIGLSYISDNRNGLVSGREIKWDISGPFNPGANILINITAEIDQSASGILVNLAVATGNSVIGNHEKVGSSTRSVIKILQPSINVEKRFGLPEPVQYEQYCDSRKVTGTGKIDVSTTMLDKNLAMKYGNLMKGNGDIELESENTFSEKASKLQRQIGNNTTSLNLYENTKMTYSGETPLSGGKYLESKEFFGGIGARIQEAFSVNEMEKDQQTFFASTDPTSNEVDQNKSNQLRNASSTHLVALETKNSFNGTWGTDASWHKIFYKDINAHEMFTGAFEADKLIKFHKNPVPEKEHNECEGIDR